MSAKKYLKIPASANNNSGNSNNPGPKDEMKEKLWNALKKHIMKERERKKQELEAEVEEERLRKEREAREKRDVMTLGETREQIQLLETRLNELVDEKQQLFLQLKKVVNEDVSRKRKEANERYIQQQQQAQQQQQQQQQQQAQQQQQHPLFLQHNPPSGGISHQQLMPKVIPAYKRQRSPSPTSVNPHYNKTGQAAGLYIHPNKIEDGRRNEVSRAVLWNKTAQYNTPGTLFYPTAQTAYGAIRPSYPEIISRQLKPELNNKPPTSQSGSGSQAVYHMMDQSAGERSYHADMDNKDLRAFYKPDGIYTTSVHMPQRVIVPNQTTNMQGIQSHQIQQPQQPPRIIPRYSRYPQS